MLKNFFAGVALLFLTSNIALADWFGPDNYEDCVLDLIGDAKTESSAALIQSTCRAKFPHTDPIPSRSMQDTVKWICLYGDKPMVVTINKEENVMGIGKSVLKITHSTAFKYWTEYDENGTMFHFRDGTPFGVYLDVNSNLPEMKNPLGTFKCEPA